ncbi:D-alanyl-D-alanine carboxypeptidase family protein [Roseomonas sp. HF4]|uniref:D-alanyl-D-alanine carboxypeptidase family protein n=1 Tax=Roseomonas sp. HF4 TaxID=2562313 RepID=UPI0010C01AD6|nr:D-alanyl-D-alanine carboxypeptidase family protein [Roseomonas sp. HF4]
MCAPLRLAAACVALVAAWLAPQPAAAQIGGERYAALVAEARTGRVLIAANADEQRYPASLTKMMTLYMVFEALREGRVQLSTPIRMSEEAASRPPSKLGLPPGASLTVEQAILALVTKSANDVAAAVAEHLGGTEDRFAQMMTMRARAIGMSRTTFRNASGLPDPDNVSTARDLATLGLRLFRDFPNRYHYFSTVRFNWGRIAIRNHNRMLGDYAGADGIKTGYIRASGFNIVTSAERDGIRLVGVTMGGSSWVERDQHMGALLDQGFAQLGVAARPPSSAMAAVPVVRGARAAPVAAATPARRSANARASRRTPDRRAVATRAAPTQPRVGSGRGTTAAAAATRAVAPPATARPPQRRAAAPRAGRIEQGSRSTTPVSARRGTLPPPVPRTTSR